MAAETQSDLQRMLRRRDFLRHSATLGLFSLTGLSSLSCRRASEETGVGPADAVAAASELSSYDGIGLTELLQKGDVSALELVEDTLRRVEAVNPQLNAVLPSLFDVEKALDRARGELGAGPLAGVPVLLKNLTSYSEARIDSGSRLMARARERDTLPPMPTSPFVQAMEDSGMIISGITSSPEFGLIDVTEPVLHGATRNPWHPDYTPGGSSGGSGAAVAAGIVPIAHANDGGGSIRLPASHCGLVGLKPTRARELAGEDGDLAIANDLCVSRTVRDTAAFLSVVERQDNPDLPPVGYVEGPSSKRLKVALLLESASGQELEPVVQLGIRRTAEKLEELGHEVQEIPLPFDGEEFWDTFIGFWATSTVEMLGMVESLAGPGVAPEEVLEPWTLGLAQLATDRGVGECVERATKLFPQLNAAMEGVFGTYDVILSPVLGVSPFKIGYHSPTGDFDTILARVVGDVGYTPIHNAVGTPAISLPLSQSEHNLPVGNQFAAWRGGERMLLELAYELEEAMPWRDRRPQIYAS